MGKSIKITHLAPLVLLATSIFFYGCQKDAFNPEKVKATYQNKFPVKDIAPAMDWKMTQQIQVTVSVFEDAGIDYTVRIYDANPLDGNSSAQLLTEGTANDKMSFTTTMDCPITITDVYVCRTDPQRRNVVKVASINGNDLNVTFGISPVSRLSTRAENSSITTYTPDRTETEIASLSAQAQELRNNTVIRSGEVYKISQGSTFKGEIYTDGISGQVGTVIIEGTWDPKGNIAAINTGIDLIVTSTGKIILPDGEKGNKSLKLIGTSRIIVFKGGIIEGDDDAYIYLSNASGGRYNYNAGTIDVETFQMDEEKAVLYNCGSLDIEDLIISNVGGRLINQGRAVIGKTTVNNTIENGCYLEVTEHLYGDLIMGDNCGASIEEYGAEGGNAGKKFVMGNNSMITIKEDAYLNNGFSVTGPSQGYALIKIGELEDIGNFSHKGGNIYYEIKEIDSDITGDIWWQAKFLEALKNTDGTISKWGESPCTIPSGDCTGNGNKPNSSGSDTSKEPMPYTYVFEDNFPLVGDYDFNDVVLDVTLNYDRGADNKITATRINVKLAATGASKPLGAGLRIVGEEAKAAIERISFEGTDVNRFQSTLSGSVFSTGIENDGTISLFGNAHKVFGVPSGTLVNTGMETAPVYTYQIKIEHKNAYQQETPAITKDNLDFFIAYQYKTMEKRMEVHLYEFWKYGATEAGTIQKENLDLAGNNTWAICVPGKFGYPKEYINISNQEEENDCAYPLFLNWARDRNVNKDWYEHPNEENVYR